MIPTGARHAARSHILCLIGSRNRVTIPVKWLWAYVSFQRRARLVTRANS
jgi:hypothetical protein